MNDDSEFERDVMPFTAELYRRALGDNRNAADAEDLAQETMLKAFKGHHKLCGEPHFRAWLLRIRRNTWISTTAAVCAGLRSAWSVRCRTGSRR